MKDTRQNAMCENELPPIIPKKNQKKIPTVGSLFSGCGGLDLGFVWAGCKILWANDSDLAATKTYKEYMGDHITHCDVQNYSIEKLKKVDIIIGGFPCQDFSVIWKRPGLNGTRGNLYSYLVKAIRIHKPKVFIVENVKGIISIDKGKAIKKIKSDFEKIGYQISADVYNFADYGAPQTRERVLLIGIRDDLKFKFKKIPPTHTKHVTAGEALKGVGKIKHNNQQQNIADKTKKMLALIPEGKNFSAVPKESPYYVKGMISHVYRRLHRKKPSTTIIANGGGGTWGYHFKENRSLTNRERARLFGFPDDMEFFGSMSEVRRQIGNAVPPVAIRPIAEEIVAILKGDPKHPHIKIT